MKVGIMQPYFVPYIGYWQLINAVDKYVVYDDVNYIKGGWINRNRILMNGEAKMISLKVSGASPNRLISEIGLMDDQVYKSKLLRTIDQCYKKAPYYSSVYPLVEEIIGSYEDKLSHYLTNSMKIISGYLGITTEFLISSQINIGTGLKGEERIIKICKNLDASEYYNAIGGISLYSHETFRSNGLGLEFLRTDPIEYYQLGNQFVPNLSIIDVMMFNSKIECKELLDAFMLV